MCTGQAPKQKCSAAPKQSDCCQGFWIYLYFRIRHSFAHLRPVILSADWSISRLQSWTCSSLSTVAEFVKLTQSIVIEIQRQSADWYKVQLCNRQFFVVSTAVYVVKVYECHPLVAALKLRAQCVTNAQFVINAQCVTNAQCVINPEDRCTANQQSKKITGDLAMAN